MRYVLGCMKNRSRLAILAAAVVLGGASFALAAHAADVASTPAPASPGAAQQEQQETTETPDATETPGAAETPDATETADPPGAEIGHQDVPGTPDETGDHQD
jgi:hypothetical protein